MLYYLVIFFISITFTSLAGIIAGSHKKNKAVFLVFSFIAVLLPAALAGFRDSGIGTDTLVYVDNIFLRCVYVHNIEDFFTLYNEGYFDSIEFFYLMLNYIVSRFTTNVNWFYFFTSFITITFFYKAAYDNKEKASMWMVMAFFLFLFYNHSLNLVRQSIALAMTIYAFKYIENRRWWKTAFWALIIFNTHKTGVFFLVLPINYVICTSFGKKTKKFLKIITIGAIASIFLFFDQLLMGVISIGLIPDISSLYLSSESDVAIAKTELVVYMLFLILLFYARNQIKRDKQNYGFYIYNKTIGTLLFLTSMISRWVNRISFYINVMDCIIIPRTIYLFSKRKTTNIILQTLTVLLLLAYWYWKFILSGDGNTSTYSSKILGI